MSVFIEQMVVDNLAGEPIGTKQIDSHLSSRS